MEASKSTYYYLPSQTKTSMSSATRDPEVKRLGDPDWDFSEPRSLTGPPVTCSIQLAADRMKDTKGVTAIEAHYKQWLKCNGTQGNAVPLPPVYGSKRSPTPPQIVIILAKGTRPLSRAQN